MSSEFLISLLIAGPIILYLLIWLGKRQKVSRAEIARQWNNVKSLESSENAQYAVVEADKVFDTVLKQLGFKGQTMGERLKSAGPSITNINQIWSAHKLRNQLVHENNPKINKQAVKSAVASFEKALKGLGAL